MPSDQSDALALVQLANGGLGFSSPLPPHHLEHARRLYAPRVHPSCPAARHDQVDHDSPPQEGHKWEELKFSKEMPAHWQNGTLKESPARFHDQKMEKQYWLDRREPRSISQGQLDMLEGSQLVLRWVPRRWIVPCPNPDIFHYSSYWPSHVLIAEEDWRTALDYKPKYSKSFQAAKWYEIADITFDISAVIGRALGNPSASNDIDNVCQTLKKFTRMIERGVPENDFGDDCPFTMLPRVHLTRTERPYVLFRQGKRSRVCHDRVWLQANPACHGPISIADARGK